MQIKTKKDLRERIQTLLRNQKEEERLKKSLIIQNKLFGMPEYQKAGVILLYASFDGEVETFEIIKRSLNEGKTVALPKIIQKDKKIIPTKVVDLTQDLKKGSYGVFEPFGDHLETVPLDKIDMIIVPGIAYDRSKNRLGRGAGYYDRFLHNIPPLISTIGLAFDFQIVDRLPNIDSHDIPVKFLISN